MIKVTASLSGRCYSGRHFYVFHSWIDTRGPTTDLSITGRYRLCKRCGARQIIAKDDCISQDEKRWVLESTHKKWYRAKA